MGLASCLWLVRTVPYFVTASGHNLTFSAVVMNIVRYLSVDDNGDRSGYDEFVSHYGVRVGPSVW